MSVTCPRNQTFVFTFMVPYAKNLRRWADQTKAEIESWEDLSADRKAARAVEIIRSAWYD
jgi:hypothetical protein